MFLTLNFFWVVYDTDHLQTLNHLESCNLVNIKSFFDGSSYYIVIKCPKYSVYCSSRLTEEFDMLHDIFVWVKHIHLCVAWPKLVIGGHLGYYVKFKDNTGKYQGTLAWCV